MVALPPHNNNKAAQPMSRPTDTYARSTSSAESQTIENMAKDATIYQPVEGDSQNSSGRKPTEDSYWPTIATKDQIPGWLRDNDFIVGGHPMPTYGYRKSLRLWRCLHMESMNIWTHLFGCAACVAVGCSLYSYGRSSHTPQLQIGDKFALGISTACAATCFALSATFHTLRSHSFNVHHFWGRMDILGICIFAMGGGCSATYYAWFCNSTARYVYWALNLSSAAAAAVTLFDTGGGGSKMRALRGGVFSLLAISAMLPVVHYTASVGWSQACVHIGTQWYLAEALSLLLGVGFFVGRMPERLSPGSFDIWGHSHQLFHICAMAGAAFHFVALMTGHEYRLAHPRC